MDQHEDIWLVQLANGAVRAMTLDELDAAYQEGAIDEDTYVRRDGSTKWSRLRDELGADEPAAPPPPAPAPVSYGAVPSYAPPQIQAQPLYSTRPVVSEIDLDELEAPFKKSRKGTFAAIGGVALAAVAVAVFAATKMGGAPAADVGASVANATQPPAVVTPPPPATTEAAPASTLNDDQKKALSELDQQHEKKWEQQRKTREHYHAPAKWHPSHTPFHKGGSKYDPLNAKL